MVEAAEEAKKEVDMGKEAFLAAGLAQKALLLDLIHFTESAEKLSAGFKNRNSRIDWSFLSRLRNQGLVHEYQDVNLEDIWKFAHDQLPRLRRALDRLDFGPAAVNGV
jgi:uncharacterized protein with HEPN domain